MISTRHECLLLETRGLVWLPSVRTLPRRIKDIRSCRGANLSTSFLRVWELLHIFLREFVVEKAKGPCNEEPLELLGAPYARVMERPWFYRGFSMVDTYALTSAVQLSEDSRNVLRSSHWLAVGLNLWTTSRASMPIPRRSTLTPGL
jgi:hypothetical protein